MVILSSGDQEVGIMTVPPIGQRCWETPRIHPRNALLTSNHRAFTRGDISVLLHEGQSLSMVRSECTRPSMKGGENEVERKGGKQDGGCALSGARARRGHHDGTSRAVFYFLFHLPCPTWHFYFLVLN